MYVCVVKVRSGHRVVTVRRVKCSSLKFHRVPYGNEKLVSGCCRKLARADCSFVANNVPKLRVTLNLVHFVDIDDKVTTLINCQVSLLKFILLLVLNVYAKHLESLLIADCIFLLCANNNLL